LSLNALAIHQPLSREEFMKLALAACIALLVTAPCHAGIDSAVKTQSGMVSGVAGRDAAITAFKGIPYAKPPVGKLRWALPQAPAKWKGVRRADQFSAGCAQLFPKATFPQSEDCLYLNVWTPAKAPNAKLPVMVWIHGGGLRVGASAEALYDGEEIAKKGVVVVSFNYRLDVFGFFAHPELSKKSGYGASGNYGHYDQLAALRWVQRNVAAFGGDPSKVTIFGQSAGAYSVANQVASPMSKGLFRAAIIESLRGNYALTPMQSLSEAEAAGTAFARSVGANSLAELRALPVEKLLAASHSAGAPTANVDGRFLPRSPDDVYRSGNQNKVPVMIGSNSDEAQHSIKSALSSVAYIAKAETAYGSDAAAFLALYPGGTDLEAKEHQQRQLADVTALGEQAFARFVSASGQTAYNYYFSYVDNGSYNAEPVKFGLKLGADHGSELPYTFGLLNHWDKPVPDTDRNMQTVMMGYWVNFAKALDPNGEGLPIWKPVAPDSDEIMVFGDKIGMRMHPRAAQIRFLRSHPAQ
jgi:para-nitrobenzyl esterase